MVKNTNEQPVEEIHRANGMERSFYTLSANTFICTPTWKLSKLCTLGNFVKPSSCRLGQSLTQSPGSLLSLEEVGCRTDISKVLIMAWLSVYINKSLLCVHILNNVQQQKFKIYYEVCNVEISLTNKYQTSYRSLYKHWLLYNFKTLPLLDT